MDEKLNLSGGKYCPLKMVVKNLFKCRNKEGNEMTYLFNDTKHNIK